MNQRPKEKKPFVTGEQGFMLAGAAIGLAIMYISTPVLQTEGVEGMLIWGLVAAVSGGIGKVVGKLVLRRR
jgi:hypothetical protein